MDEEEEEEEEEMEEEEAEEEKEEEEDQDGLNTSNPVVATHYLVRSNFNYDLFTLHEFINSLVLLSFLHAFPWFYS